MKKEQLETTEVNVLDDLDELDKAIIRYRLEGFKITEIANKVEKHRDTVKKRLTKVKVEQAIKELQKEAIDILIDTQAEAARTLRHILKTGTDENKIRAAKEILKGVLSDKVNIESNTFAEWVKSVNAGTE
jgi:gamma-glutamyl:cysteine ligase YbdK (ATP-grasp superfamily)